MIKAVIVGNFGGITGESKAWIKRRVEYGKLGALEMVTVKRLAENEWETKLYYWRAVLVTDGFSMGYFGEGPAALLDILGEAGLWGPDPRQEKPEIGERIGWAVDPLSTTDEDMRFVWLGPK